MSEFLKAEQISNAKWRVLAIPFGGPFGGKDFDGEYFSKRTDIKAGWFPERPVMFHHGGDPVIKDENLGTEDDLEMEKDGWWATVWLDRSNRYWEHVNGLLGAGKMYGSSGALGHLVQKARDGEILVWPHIEQTLTPTPANPFARVVPAKAIDHFTLAGIPVPDLGQDLPFMGGDDSATARARLLAMSEANLALLRSMKGNS